MMKQLMFISAVLISLIAANPVTKNEVNNKTIKAINYRLPRDILPENYKIELTPYLAKEGAHEQFTFDGKCEIIIVPSVSVTNIILHKSEDMDIDESKIKLVDLENEDEIEIKVADIHYDSITEFYSLPLKEPLDKEKRYKISFEFIGKMNDQMSGFYRSSYTEMDSENKPVTKWIATTQFQPTHARKAFPCFDEPLFKATFDISIIRLKCMKTIGNQDHLKVNETVPGDNNRVKDTFNTTPKMSTYLVAFVVSEFKSVSEKADRQDFDVWARPNAYTQGKYSYDIGKKTLHELEKFTNYSYKDQKMNKMDMVALPDFSAGAMENWGLLTFRETALLYDEKISTELAKQRVATVVAHEQAHMWFGDLVTCEWWEHTWLNEGFARYLQYYITDKVEPQWNLMEQIVVEQQQTVFGIDSLTSAKALSSHVDSSGSISAHFDSISYNKGASVIRMMEHIVTTATFQKALQNYLKNKKFQTVVPSDLFREMQKQVDADKVYDDKIDISQIMKNWVFENGYPVITVEQAADKMVIQQNRFLRHDDDTAPKTQYYIPLSYTSKSEKKFSTKPRVFLKDTEKSIHLPLPNENYEWVIFNIKGTGYYRVNYDEQTWKLLSDALREDNFDGIETLSRAQLVDDALSLARAEHEYLKYETALELIHYLQKETGYLPWTSAFQGLSYIYKRLCGNDGNRHEIEIYINNLMKKLYDHLGFHENEKDNPVTKYSRAQALSWACKVGHEDCIKNSQQMFADFKQNKTVPPNLRPTVYCTALRHGDGDDFDFLWEKYLEANVAAEQILILNSLGCTKDKNKLELYLSDSLKDNSSIRKQDAATVFTSVYSGNPQNVRIAFDFLKNNPKEIANSYTAMNGLNNAISGLASSLTSADEVKEMEEFLNKHAKEMGITEEVVKKALQQAKTDLDWNTKYSAGIMDWIKRTNSSVTLMSSLLLCFIAGLFTQVL